MKHNVRIIIALLIIIVVCWFGYTYTEEINKVSNATKPFKQQLQRYTWLIVIGLVTYWAFLKHPYQWIAKTIILIYALTIVVLGFLGLLEFKWKLFSENQKELISSVRLFLSSPLPFIMAWFLSVIDLSKLQEKN